MKGKEILADMDVEWLKALWAVTHDDGTWLDAILMREMQRRVWHCRIRNVRPLAPKSVRYTMSPEIKDQLRRHAGIPAGVRLPAGDNDLS